MLRLTLELIPRGNEHVKSVIGTLEIENICETESKFGEYKWILRTENFCCDGNIKHFLRKRGRWQLIKEILNRIELDITAL